ncbi:MAG: hypothetical protein ISQ34_03390 [Rickettsiales bacterium]|nr:hypothetical protein [Rickettsiales bacterium]
MTWGENFGNDFNNSVNNKDSLFYQRPWYYRVPMMTVGLTSIGFGAAITVGTFGFGTPVGATLIGVGSGLCAGSVSSSAAVKERHALFDIAQKLEGEKEDGQKKYLQNGNVFGNLVPYLKTYIPFSGARGYLQEIKGAYDTLKNNNPDAETKFGQHESVKALLKKHYEPTPHGQERQQKTHDVSKSVSKINRESASVPGTSIAAIACRTLSNLNPRNWFRGSGNANTESTMIGGGRG